MELAVVGRDDFVLGFKLAGVRKVYSVPPEAFEAKVNEVVEDPEVGILVVNTEDLQALSHGTRRRLETVPRPVVIAVGSQQEEDLRTKVKRAIGIDLFK
ncbi:MAG TPA: V-type ATP synthase subunit F [Thermoplasmata archaeon]|nr:V-type ATP synthase subunit F [Thermoplasmata archaeon]